MDGVDALTPVAQDYLKVIWAATEWGDPPITTKGLAARFGTTQANVSETVRRLASQGLVDYEPYRPVVLTERGIRLAMAMVRRHRLIECFLAGVLGYGWDEVHDEAERLEHAVTDDFLTRIDRLLDHPRFDPHGDPIPSADGKLPTAAPAILLADAGPGWHLVARVSDADPDVLARLRSRGLVPGVVLDSADLDLADPDLAAVRVRPAPASLLPSPGRSGDPG